MNRNKEVLKYCPNFYTIVNFDFDEEDYVSEKLVSVYKDYLFKAKLDDIEEIESVKKIDYVLGKYIDDYIFRKEMSKELVKVRISKTCDNILKAIVDSIIAIFNHYQEYTTRNIYISRWI